jgi:hypothetical protein
MSAVAGIPDLAGIFTVLVIPADAGVPDVHVVPMLLLSPCCCVSAVYDLPVNILVVAVSMLLLSLLFTMFLPMFLLLLDYMLLLASLFLLSSLLLL